MNLKAVLCFLIKVSPIFAATNVLRPRGVSLQKNSFYDPDHPFTCFDGSTSIPFERVNDDYCDCHDGSDEPGTAACLNGSFHCNNIGHKPKDIVSAYVNDGYCDCCDASDEYASEADCTNVCQELGKAAREEEMRMMEEQLKGYNIRQHLAEEGLKIKKEKQARLMELEREKETTDEERAEKEALKDSAEVPEKEALEKYKAIEEEKKKQKQEAEQDQNENEASEAFTALDEDGDGYLSPQDLQKNPLFDTNKDGVVSEEEAMFYLHHEEDIDIDKFISTVWMFVKPTYKYGRQMFTPPDPMDENNDETLDQEQTEPLEGKEPTQEHSQQEGFAEDLKDEVNEDVDDYSEEDEHDDDDDIDDETDIEDQKAEIVYDEETQRLVDTANAARKEFKDVDGRLKDIVREIQQIKDNLERDFGPNEEFRSLDGVCYEYSDREYTYKICPFDHAVQKPLSGHGETRLGTWGHWDGPADDKYSIMKYTGGQSCWNGPQRSAEVRLYCSTENKLTSVTEPNRCEYLFQFSTPVLCTQPTNVPHIHTEL